MHRRCVGRFALAYQQEPGAALARDNPIGAGSAFDTARQFVEGALAALMTEQRVDTLEQIDVDHGHLQGPPRPLRQRHRALQAFVERDVVGQTGQVVVGAAQLKLALRDCLRRHITALDQQAGDLYAIAMRNRLQDVVKITRFYIAPRTRQM